MRKMVDDRSRRRARTALTVSYVNGPQPRHRSPGGGKAEVGWLGCRAPEKGIATSEFGEMKHRASTRSFRGAREKKKKKRGKNRLIRPLADRRTPVPVTACFPAHEIEMEAGRVTGQQDKFSFPTQYRVERDFSQIWPGKRNFYRAAGQHVTKPEQTGRRSRVGGGIVVLRYWHCGGSRWLRVLNDLGTGFSVHRAPIIVDFSLGLGFTWPGGSPMETSGFGPLGTLAVTW